MRLTSRIQQLRKPTLRPRGLSSPSRSVLVCGYMISCATFVLSGASVSGASGVTGNVHAAPHYRTRYIELALPTLQALNKVDSDLLKGSVSTEQVLVDVRNWGRLSAVEVEGLLELPVPPSVKADVRTLGRDTRVLVSDLERYSNGAFPHGTRAALSRHNADLARVDRDFGYVPTPSG